MLVRWRGIYRFNTQPPEGGCIDSAPATFPNKVSTHSRLKAAGSILGADGYWLAVSTHSRLKAAVHQSLGFPPSEAVSTHSRLKAAGAEAGKEAPPDGFNTQPPEGGCMTCQDKIMRLIVSTHSRLKAAGYQVQSHYYSHKVSTHSRLKAADQPVHFHCLLRSVSTHSRLKAAGAFYYLCGGGFVFQHTAA